MTKKILELSELYDVDFLNGSLKNAAELLNDLLEKCGEDATIEFSCDLDYHGSYIESDCYIRYKREETDKECKERLELDERFKQNEKDRRKKQRQDRETRDKRDYARLKKKFEKTEIV